MNHCPKQGPRMMALVSAWVCLGLFACKSTQISRPLDIEGSARDDESAFAWQLVSEGELITHALAPRMGTVKSRPRHDPLRQRLQFWLEQLDIFLREKDLNAMKNVPKPQIFLLDHAAPHAFVPGMEACLNKAGQMQGAEGISEDFLGIDRELGGILSEPGPRPCLKLPYQGAQLQRFLDWYLKPLSGCSARISQKSAVFGPECLLASLDGLKTPAQTREVFVRLSGHWIVVSTGLMQNLTESEAVYTLFHEAAHYYRAHLSHPSMLYNYFYNLESNHSTPKPAADRLVAELGQEFLYWLKAKEAGTRAIAAGAPGQRYHSGLYVIARHVIQDWIRQEAEQTACKDLSQHFISATGLNRFPLEAPDSRGQESYALYETKVKACLAALPLDAQLQSRMIGFIPYVAPWSPKVLSQVPNFTRVQELWDWLNIQLPLVIAAPETRLAQLSKQADALGLRPYTREQEADDLAVEWLTQFGIDPRQGLQATLKLLQIEAELSSSQSRAGAYRYEQCRQALAANFRDANGRELRVPVGEYGDLHRSSCYRAFHMHRQITRHDYANKLVPQRVSPPAPGWETLVR